MKLLDYRRGNNWREFARFKVLPKPTQVAKHLEQLPGVTIEKVVELPITWEGFVEFRYQGHAFSIGEGFGDLSLDVDDPECPEDLLLSIVNHFAIKLGDPWQPAQTT